MKKTFILDTNVLLRDPNSIKKFENNDVVLPITVIEELDNFKKGHSTINQNAREVIRTIDKLREKGSLSDGVQIGKNKGKLYINSENYNFSSMDNRILKFTKEYIESNTDKEIILVTKDLNLRIKADSIGIISQDYLNDKLPESEISVFEDYIIKTETDTILKLHNEKLVTTDLQLNNNFYYLLISKDDEKMGCPVKFKDGVFYKIAEIDSVQGLTPMNVEQRFLIDAILDPEIELIFVKGRAGVGKTQLAVGCGMELIDKAKFKKLFIARATIPLTGNKYNDYGALPGDIEEKLNPWFGSVFDSLETIYDNGYNELLQQKIIELGAIGFLRGRTLKDRIVVIDEAQNNSPIETKTIISRIGKNSKCIVMGDPEQIDNQFLTKYDNGLVYASEILKGKKGVTVISMTKCQRSYISELSQEL